MTASKSFKYIWEQTIDATTLFKAIDNISIPAAVKEELELLISDVYFYNKRGRTGHNEVVEAAERELIFSDEED